MDPPAYSPRSQTEHIYQLTNSSGPWASLRVFSRARRAHQLPVFLEGDIITGSLTLDLSSADHILAITVVVKGKLVSSISHFNTACVFLDELQTLWCKEMGDPRSPSSKRYSGKLFGSYFWPFSITLPSHVYLDTSSAPSGPFRLPETFLERHSQTSIQYDIEAHITRSRFRVNSKLQTMFLYVPGTRPPPPSLLRQLAHQDNRPAPGPEIDPEGWHQVTPFTLHGLVFKTRRADVQCLFYLAKPLCYTRGSPIPCAATIWSSDAQAVDLLASPHSANVRLRRCVRSQSNSTHLSPMQIPRSSCTDACDKDSIQDVAEAVWWPSSAVSEHHITKKSLMGEILLPLTLKPSCRIGNFSIEYSVDVLSFQSSGFTVLQMPMTHQTVEIATLSARYLARTI